MIRPVCQEDFCERCDECLDCCGGDPCGDSDRDHVWPAHLRIPFTGAGLPRCNSTETNSKKPCRMTAKPGFERCWRHEQLEGSRVIPMDEGVTLCHRCNTYAADCSIIDRLCWRCGMDQVSDDTKRGM